MTGYSPLVWPLPQPKHSPMLLAIVQAERARPPSFSERGLYDAIWQRHTNRNAFTDQPLPDSVSIALEQAAGFEFASLRMLTVREAASVIELATVADRAMTADFAHQVELGQWVATGSQQDGIPAAALPARPDRWPTPVRDFSSVTPTIERPPTTYERYPQLAVIATARDEPADWLRAGQALQRVLLTATAHGVSSSFLYQPIELHDMRGADAPAWPWHEHPQMIIRFGYGVSPPHTPRRPLDDILIRTGESAD